MSAGTDKVLVIEQRGIQLVPPEERHGVPSELFWMWLGTNLNVFYVINGAIIIALGLSFGQALIAIVIGSLAFFGVGVTSLQGPKTGTSTFMVSRAAFGPNGGRGVSVLNWVNFVGYEASGIALIVLAILELLSRAGIHSSAGLKAVVIFGAAAVQFVLPLYGHATITTALRWLSYLLVPLFAVMAVLIAPKVHFGSLSQGAGWASVMVAIALIAAGGGLGWTTAGSDYTRYLPEKTRPSQIFWAASLSGMLASALLAVLGAAVASVVKTASDPIAGLPQAFPAWVLVPYLILFVATCLAVNTIDLYSSGLTLQAIGVPVKRWVAALIDLVICIGLTFFALFSSTFNRLYSEMLSLLIVFFAPWFAIYVTDWLLRRGRYDPASLVSDGRGGRYWRKGGVHVPGVVAMIAGMAATLMWLDDAPTYVGPLSSRTHGSDFSIFMGIGVAAAVYWVLARRSVPAEEGIMSAPAPAAAHPQAVSLADTDG
jgi:NCS1 family nucleobase:cation symporter-1